ncbi:MAG: PD40 domain-containing protein [Phycisphaerales bacterium]|nr:PD40 domain-containing protein [Phycisphaerales bacterium]
MTMRNAATLTQPLSTARLAVLAGLALPVAALSALASAQPRPHAGMLRFPDVSATHIVFVYANDLWTVPRAGGVATPLASPDGAELFPRFSPDGQTIAFLGSYDAGRDIYTIPVDGGLPFRVTHHPAAESTVDWTPDAQLVFTSNGLAGQARASEIFTVPATGGLPTRLPIPTGSNPALSADGWIAYTNVNRDFRTWKRYRGGLASDIWLFNPRTGASRQATDFEGTDTIPMWHNGMLYYLSDAGPEHRLNIWRFDPRSGQRTQITTFADNDVKFPAIGPGERNAGEIVFQHGPDLMLLDLASGRSRTVEVTIPGAQPRLRPQTFDAAERIDGWSISPNARRVVVEARGDIWTLPAEEGSPRNLTRSAGNADRNPAWSPDGRWIAYASDASGEYQVVITQSDGRGESRTVDVGAGHFIFGITWSPDSERLTFTDQAGNLFLHDVETGTTSTIIREPWAGAIVPSWSHDSSWLAFTMQESQATSAIYLHEIATATTTRVTSGMFGASSPAFDRKGNFLYYVTGMDFNSPTYEDVGTSWVYTQTSRIAMVPLRDDVESPFAATSDEETWNDEDADSEEDAESNDGVEAHEHPEGHADAHGDGHEAEAAGDADGEDETDDNDDDDSLRIDLDGFEARAILLPVDRGIIGNLAVTKSGALLFTRRSPRGIEGEPSIRLYNALETDDDKRKEETVATGVGGFELAADAEHLLVNRSGRTYIIEARPNQKFESAVPTGGMNVTIDPREEWAGVYRDAWRRQRDYFYDPTMHGVDWNAVYEQYAAMLPDCASRDDVGFVISEMISELNVGHAYYRSGPTSEGAPGANVAMLGCDFDLGSQDVGGRTVSAYRITSILRAGAWDIDARSPLDQPGLDVAEGDFLLEVNGMPVDTSKDPWAAFEGLAGQTITLTISSRPVVDDDARRIVVDTMRSDSGLRYRAWVEQRRQYVAERTDGQVAYIHVPDTGVNGQNNLVRQYFGQIHMPAMIVDERWNGGGQIPTRFIELLNRPATNYWARRDGHDWPWPPDAHFGPKAMLINGPSGSGGDAFPWYFRQAGLGPLVGTRTWGGLVGITGVPGLIDGASVSVPTFAFYESDGTWGIEGHGVDPDYVVSDDPALWQNGRDPQLDKAIELMLEAIRTRPYTPPQRPAYPNRRGMGIPASDR